MNKNYKYRLDSGFFSKEAVIAEARVEELPNYQLGSISAVFRKGIFDIKADTYVEVNEGVPFVRIGDLKNGLIQKSTTAWIDETVHKLESKTAVTAGDLILSKTAYAAASLVNIPECNVSQDTIAVRLNEIGKKYFQSGYIAAFLNTRQGHALMARRFQGNVQQHLSLEDGKAVRIPLYSENLQRRVHSLVLAADRLQDDVTSKQDLAEAALLTALGPGVWTPSEPLSYTGRASEVVEAKRLDAQYYMPAKEQVKRSLAALPGRLLSERVDSIRDMFAPDRAAATMLVRNYDVTDALIPLLDAEKEMSFATEMGSVKKTLMDGDVAVSRLRSYLKEIAVVRTGDDAPSVGSSEFIVLRLKRGQGISPETLMVFLRSAPVQTILKWCQDGSQHPRFSEEDLLSIPVPDAVESASDEITGIVRLGFAARHQARQFLETAKRAVEVAMENSEAAALAYLDRILEEK